MNVPRPPPPFPLMPRVPFLALAHGCLQAHSFTVRVNNDLAPKPVMSTSTVNVIEYCLDEKQFGKGEEALRKQFFNTEGANGTTHPSRCFAGAII
ncbi:Uu.00g111140.m01.CDS01 [Anthostomella pinea]|uniref:Uu.00g111140.m01.CDS01 n=1 Tax=Anthostomella pinea TaxID=933095 RepID=A0AAI8YGC5_9PEZI|nr:Uu.00g111140.m01.CDS01 [Anthostomella pinea]